MHNIKVISSDIDGLALRREKVQSKYFIRCDGLQDDEQINEALNNTNKSRLFTMPDAIWQRIFGENK